jgi:hypothetical protein
MPLRLSVVAIILINVCPSFAGKLLPWQSWIVKPAVESTKSLESVFSLPWKSTGGPEGKLSIAPDKGPWGGRYFDFHVKVDWKANGKRWPAFEIQPNPPLDFAGWDAIRYWIRCDTDIKGDFPIRFILQSSHNWLNTEVPKFARGQWVQVTYRIHNPVTAVPYDVENVSRVHFFLCDDQYQDGDEMTFKIGGFELVKLQKEASRLPAGEAALGLWVGKRADTSDEAVILDRGTSQLPMLFAVETGAGVAMKASDELRVRYHEVFTGRETSRSIPLGTAIPDGQIARLSRESVISDLRPGYYLVTADILREGKSLLGGRVGCDDLYIRRPGESMTYTVLSIRAAMAKWVQEPVFGDLQGRTHIALPHVYDPLNPDTLQSFLWLFSYGTGTHTEGQEAGDTGLILAAEAFRKSGDLVRAQFTENLFEQSLTHMMARNQAPSGGVVMETNDLGAKWAGQPIPKPGEQYDSNQIGEWMRPMAYAMIYYSRIPEKRAFAMKLEAACHKAADFLVAHSLQTSDGIPRVMRHFTLKEKPDGSVEAITYWQEGKQCDVYLGRALAGFAYYAYAMQLLGQKVPDEWWEVMDNTAKWCGWKMKPNGWFDWQCGDVVEGGCHTFLGNLYVGEGLFGVYMADRQAGRVPQATEAGQLARKAYRYTTDDCWIKGVRYTYPEEFWVGPYTYWLFTEYLNAVGPDPVMTSWLRAIDRNWVADRKWCDFIGRPSSAKLDRRTTTNGALELAILGYLGCRQMEQIGKPLHWETAG